jgi:UDP-N-acetylmuramoyl-L-alanyl-D-glutamate--2,6-diaminopimelate ligase
MILKDLLSAMPAYELDGVKDVEIKGIAYDSRKISEGYLFVAIKGNALDGHAFLDEAVRRGAVAVVGENFENFSSDAVRVKVPDSRAALARLSTRFYDDPCRDIELIGITGTNGKTTTTYLIESILNATGARPGVIGTINSRFKGVEHPSSVTTPESLDLMAVIREMADGGATHVIMEASSHALDQGRIGTCPYSVGVFTNLTRDHLDYHRTMEEYFEAKSLLFRGLIKDRHGLKGTAAINMDDPKGEALRSMTMNKVITYGLAGRWDVTATNVTTDRNGLKAVIKTPDGDITVSSSLIGTVNLYNILAAVSVAVAIGVGHDSIARGVNELKCVPGRLEPVKNKRGLTILVDYAHTPDALIKAQTTLRPLTKGRLITVFGCGGDRDRGKRPEMGVAAGELSDVVFITSDNPRTEDPDTIIEQIVKGIEKTRFPRLEWKDGQEVKGPGFFIETDRHRAIEKAVATAKDDDIILIAGKGHEDYQIIGKEKRFFDDRREAEMAAGGIS